MTISAASYLILVTALIAVVAIILHPHRRTLLHIITHKFFAKESCRSPSVVPRLRLRQVQDCEDPKSDPSTLPEPCVVRGAVSNEGIEEFLRFNGDQPWLLKVLKNDSVIGHPLIEPPSLASDSRIFCTLDELRARSSKCLNTYTGFKSLNFSNHAPLQNKNFELKDFQRVDSFLGLMESPKVTASFHSNNFEASGTLQLLGEKLWLMMSPTDYFGTFGAYSFGAYNAAFSTCVEDLEQVELQAIWTRPGDYLRFPKAWTHQIYTLPGPNLMLNFRNFVFNFWKLRDWLALIGAAGSSHFESHCTSESTGACGFGVGHPSPHMIHKVAMQYDMRCTDMLNDKIKQYKSMMRNFASSHDADEGIMQQILDFLNVTSPSAAVAAAVVETSTD